MTKQGGTKQHIGPIIMEQKIETKPRLLPSGVFCKDLNNREPRKQSPEWSTDEAKSRGDISPAAVTSHLPLIGTQPLCLHWDSVEFYADTEKPADFLNQRRIWTIHWLSYKKCLTFSFLFGSYLAMVRGSSWLYTHKSLLKVLGGIYRMLGTKPGSVPHKVNTLPSVLPLWSQLLDFCTQGCGLNTTQLVGNWHPHWL